MVKRSISLFPVFLSFLFSCAGTFTERELTPAFADYVKQPGIDYLEFLVAGDTGSGTSTQYAVGAAMSGYALAHPVDFVALLGDNIYDAGVASVTDPQWETKFEAAYDPAALSMPFYAVLGNHDYRGSIQAQIDYISPHNDRWHMPARYYAVSRTLPDATVIDLFFIDTVNFDTDQRLWLASQLASSAARWKIVLGHYPVYSNGWHGDTALMIQDLKPILDGAADAYLCGHDHDLEIMSEEAGVTYIVDGAGSKPRASGVGARTIFAVGRAGFMAFLISHEELVCRVIDQTGRLIYCRILETKIP